MILGFKEAVLMGSGLNKTKGAGGYLGFAFSRTVGMKHWCCPVCNQVNRTQMRPQTWVVKCVNEACGACWTIGEVFYERPTGHVVPPPDTLMPTDRALSRMPINRVYCAGCAALMYREGFKRPMEPKAEGFNQGFNGGLYEEKIEGLYEPQPWEKVGDNRRYPKGIQKLRKKGWQREEANEEMGC